MKKKYIVELTVDERQQLGEMVKAGKAAARKLPHARPRRPYQVEATLSRDS